MTAETFATDAATRRQIFIQRFAGGEARKAQAVLERMRSAILGRLARDPTDFQANRLNHLLSEVNHITAEFMRELSEQTLDTVEQFSAAEVEFSIGLLERTGTPVAVTPAPGIVQQAVLATGMQAPLGPKAITVQEALDEFAKVKAREVQRAIHDAMLLGDTLDQTTKEVGRLVTADVPKNASKEVAELINTRHKRQVEALTRTIINHTANQATKAVMVENAAILEGEKWVATLDSRTTLICGGRDGRIYPPGEGPYPPAHWNCRSRRVPVVKDELAVKGVTGKRGFVGADDKRGQVSAKTDYGSFLARQPASFQDEILGPARGKLFREGGLPIDRFRDETGRTYTLERLKELEPMAFERAGVTLA